MREKKIPRYPLVLLLCKNCFLVQLKHTTPKSLLYTENYGYKSGINNTIQEDLRDIADKSLKKISGCKKIIAIDIGANDGTLLKKYPKNVFKIGVEPIKKFCKECKNFSDIVINDFFNYGAVSKKIGSKKANVITAISCFYDIEKPNTFLRAVTRLLDKKGIFVVQQNYLVNMLRHNAFDNIVHEHLEYYSLISLTNLLKKHNLEVFDVEEKTINGGSFTTFIAFSGKRQISKKVTAMINKEKKLRLNTKKPYLEFSKNVLKNKKKLYQIIENIKKQGKRIYLYGASTRGNTLLQFYNLNSSLISFAAERNPEKWGRIFGSSGIPIISEDQARKEKPEYMLVLPWFFKNEFLKRERNYLQKGGHFIFPLPSVKVI